MESLKEQAIKQYLSNVDFRGDDWSLKKIKEDMRKFLGEEPGIDVLWEKDVMINEDTMESKEIEKVGKVSVVFFDLDEKFKKIEFIF